MLNIPPLIIKKTSQKLAKFSNLKITKSKIISEVCSGELVFPSGFGHSKYSQDSQPISLHSLQDFK